MMESAEKCNGIGICLLMKKFFIAFGTMAAASDEHHWEKERSISPHITLRVVQMTIFQAYFQKFSFNDALQCTDGNEHLKQFERFTNN